MSRKLKGIGFLIVVAALLGLTVAVYNKVFTSTVPVTLKIDNIGNQLNIGGDVKARGVPVGEIRGETANGAVATVELALQPDKVKLIPKNVQARILPKTLFGEKFVDLVSPDQPSADHISSGDVIPQDRSQAALETGKVLSDLLPLLRTVQPAKLNATLNSVSTALEGRGNMLGDNLSRTDTFFQGFNPSLPVLNQDISLLATYADTLNATAPDLLKVIDNTSFNSQTLVDKGDALVGFLQGTSGFADTTKRILDRNGDQLIRLPQESLPTLDLFAKYSGELPSIFNGLARLAPRVDDVLGGQGPFLHVRLETGPDRGAYTLPQDCPHYGNDLGPACKGFVSPGANNFGQTSYDQKSAAFQGGLFGSDGIGSVGSAAEKTTVGRLAASVIGNPQAQVTEAADLLLAPMIRGATVEVTR